MDDVVADWVQEAQRFLKRSWEAGQWIPESEWKNLEHHARFYRNLPLKDGAEELIQWARKYAKHNNMHLAFLTALPKNNKMQYASYDKFLWAQERFPEIPVFFGPYSKDKHLHCRPGDILIDDRLSNCVEWRLAGGIAHQYTTWKNCKKWIEETLVVAV